MSADKNSIRDAMRAAVSGSPPPATPAAPAAPKEGGDRPAPNNPPQSIAQRMAAQHATASEAARVGEPGAAAAAQPGEGKPAGRPTTIKDRLDRIREAAADAFPVIFNGEEVDLSVADAQRFAQVGMLADDIQRMKNELKADQQGLAAHRQFQDWLSKNPEVAGVIQDLYYKRLDPKRIYSQAQGDDFEEDTTSRGSTRGATSHGASAEDERIARLEQRIQELTASQQRQTFEQRLESAIDGNQFLASDSARREMALELISAGIATDKYPTIEVAVNAVATRLRRMADAELDLVRERREQQAQDFRQMGNQGGLSLPKMPDNLPTGPRGMRSRESKDFLKTLLGNAQRAMSTGPQ